MTDSSYLEVVLLSTLTYQIGFVLGQLVGSWCNLLFLVEVSLFNPFVKSRSLFRFVRIVLDIIFVSVVYDARCTSILHRRYDTDTCIPSRKHLSAMLAHHNKSDAGLSAADCGGFPLTRMNNRNNYDNCNSVASSNRILNRNQCAYATFHFRFCDVMYIGSMAWYLPLPSVWIAGYYT